MGVIAVVCTVFGLSVSGAKTKIICLRTKGMPESTAIFTVEAACRCFLLSRNRLYVFGT